MDDAIDGEEQDGEAMVETREHVQERAATTNGHRQEGASQLQEETSSAS